MSNNQAQTSKRQRAVALSYSEIDRVPRVVASGSAELARLILKVAQEHNIPIKEDQSLAQLLSKLEVGEIITQDCFRLVAEILSFLFFADQEWRNKHKFIEQVVAPEALPE